MDGNNLKGQVNYIISIVVPCYNCENTLDGTIESLTNQKVRMKNNTCDYQIVLVDDGSKDTTPAKCDDYMRSNSHIKALHKSNGGLVSAWKAGVNAADGKYIAFCDSDDYIDSDFVDRMQNAIKDYDPNIIVFGMMTEYSNGEKVCNDIILEAGNYDRSQIRKDLFPKLLSDGDMQSELVGSSRCNKIFTKRLLQKIMVDIPDDISFGEDDLTCFAALLNAESMYAIRGYFPYHYVRNNESMIGAYDPYTFDKIGKVYRGLSEISEKYAYSYPNQVKKEILSILFLFMKKEICKNPGSYWNVKGKLIQILESDAYRECFSESTIKGYGTTKRLFANLLNRRLFFVVYAFAKVAEGIRGRNV